MKKQWLSIVLVLCMVLCMAPTTARAAEGETGTLKITVDLSGLYDGVDAGGKTFSFEILRKYANYGHYKNVDITIKSGETAGTVDVPVEAGKYVVKQISHATIDGYDWENASHQPGNNIESNEQEVFADKTKSVTVHNFYKLAVTKEITELPITVTGYALGAKVGDIKASTDQMRVDIHKVTIKQRNASGGWDDLASDATIQANTQYAVEIFVNAKPEYTYTGLTKDKVTVNGKEASVFENPSTQSGGDMRVFYELEVLEVVKTVESIEITTPPAKTEYMAGEDFDPKGMVVTAVYDDNSKADLSGDQYVIFHGDKLTQEQTDVTIQYNDGSGSSNIKTYQAITVKPYVGPHTHTYGGPWYADAKSHWHQCTDSACPDPSGSTKDLASHTFVWKVDKAATETQTGLKHEECTVCGHKRSENTEIPLLTDTGVTTYPITVMSGKNGGVTASHKSAAKGALVTLTVDPDKGYLLDTLTVLDGKDRELKLTDKGDGKFTFTMPDSKVTVEAAFKTAGNNPFTDVPAGAYYEDAVVWAVGKGVTNGKTETLFAPDDSCTRGQVVTFLWRAAGSPVVNYAMDLEDVKGDEYYAEAVRWALSLGITKGTSDTAFSPNATCTRAQIVTFLYRAMGESPEGRIPFTDVPGGSYYEEAVSWATASGVTNGMAAGIFAPDEDCTRAQIVTFLFRAYNNK